MNYQHHSHNLQIWGKAFVGELQDHNARNITALQIIDLPLKLDDGQLSLSLKILDYVTFAPIMQLKMKHILCWNVPYTTPLEISFHHYLKTQVQGASSHSFNQTNNLTLASIPLRLPHSITLKNTLLETILIYFQSHQPFQPPRHQNKFHFISFSFSNAWAIVHK